MLDSNSYSEDTKKVKLCKNGVNVVNTTEEIFAEILLKLDRIEHKLDKLGSS